MVKVNSTQGPIPEKLVYANPGRENITVILLDIITLKACPILSFLSDFAHLAYITPSFCN